jgi:arabinose-5-phosphate isomerase
VIAVGDAVLLISVGGNSSELSSIIRYCKRLSVPILSIVGKKDSALYKESDTALLLPDFSEVILKVPSTSFTMTCLLGDALLACVVEAKAISLVQYKSYHPGGAIGSSLVQVKEIMRKHEAMPVVQLGTLMADALIEMTSKSLGCVVVVKGEGEIAGIITDGDLRRHMSNSLINMRVEEVMTSNPRVIDADSFLLDALAHMHKMKVTNLIVVGNQKLVGIVHIHDCLRLGLEASAS